jgi:hypothetical protein
MPKTYVPDVPAKRATDASPMRNASSQSLADRIGRLLSDRHGHKITHMETRIVMVPQITSFKSHLWHLVAELPRTKNDRNGTEKLWRKCIVNLTIYGRLQLSESPARTDLS